MRNTKNAFTLVELIVVITILAVLGTIAFVSLQGYSRDAKNSKVTADVRTLVSGIETALTDGTTTMNNVVTHVGSNNAVTTGNTTITNTKNGTTDTVDIAGVGVLSAQYKVGTVNFAGIKQNGDDFKDNDGNSYVAAAVSSGTIAYYQVAGELTEASGGVKTVLKGNYVGQTGEAAALISASGATTAIANGGAVSLY